MAPSDRSKQRVIAPLGQHFTSPPKKNRHTTEARREPVQFLGNKSRLQALHAKFDALRAPNLPKPEATESVEQPHEDVSPDSPQAEVTEPMDVQAFDAL